MRMKSLVFLLMFVFLMPSFAAVKTDSDSSLSAPSLVFKAWRAGRGEANQTTFITSTETTCQVSASVGYSSNLPRNTTAPIDPATVSWSFTMTHGMSVSGTPSTSWSGSHPSNLLASTSFNVLAKLSVPRHTSTSGCTSDATRASRTPQHREGKPMEISITFTARTTQGQSVSLKKKLKQDEIDQIRQIHVDMDRSIPARSEFVSDDGEREHYDFGHYTKMLYKDLKGKHGAWATAINTRERQPRSLPDLSLDDLFLTSGYRDPHHNDYHANASAKHGLHQYGLALDIRGMDVDGISGKDPGAMGDAAENANPPATFTRTYSGSGHVHADWRSSGWPPSGVGSPPSLSLPAQSTDQASTGTGGTITFACGVHSGASSESRAHTLQPSCTTDVHCIATNFYQCLHTSHEYAQDCTHTPKCGKRIHPCGCEDYTCLFPGHAIRDCPLSPSGTRCTVFYWGYYWTCNPHEHVYPGEPTDTNPVLPSRQPCQHFYVIPFLIDDFS